MLDALQAPPDDLVPLQADFEPLRPFMIGSPRQFFVWQGDTYCGRAHPDDLARKNPALIPCQGCPHFEAGCELAGEFPVEAAYRNKDDGSISGMEPHSRRGIGMEERPFLVLLFKPGHSHATMPRHLWDNPQADKAMDEANLHYLRTNPRTATFFTIKGQLRFYGTEAEFAASPYAGYLTVFDVFEPSHHIISMDKSAIEPRVCTLVTEEPRWQQVFQGTPKVISREIVLSAMPESLPRHTLAHGNRLFCYLEGELDKEEYASQCGKCPLAAACRPQVEHLKLVAGDWHALNAASFFGASFTECADPYRVKDLRKKAKTNGLAAIYGGSEYTLAPGLGMSMSEAKGVLASFFAQLPVARRYMDNIEHGLKTHGTVWNRFGRRRDMRRWSHSQAVFPDGSADRKQRFKDFSYAVRTGLNYPIQGTAGDLMKMAMIEIDALIQREGWNPLLGLAMPQSLPVGRGAYRSVVFALLSTVHDELVDLIRAGEIDRVVPKAYTAMQLQAVLRALGASFTLELDVEYDPYGSWTAGKGVATSRIYLLNRLAAEAEGGPSRPNAAIVALEDCTQEFIDGCNSYVPAEGEKPDFQIAVRANGKLYVPPGGPFTRSHVERVARTAQVPIRFALM